MKVEKDQLALLPCRRSDEVIVYARGGATADENAEMAQHISSCTTCRKLLSAYAKLVEPEITEEEERLISAVEQPVIQAAIDLYEKRPQPAPKGRQVWPELRRRWLPIAAAAVLTATLTPAFVMIMNSRRSMLERGQAAYVQSVSLRRPTQYRISQSPYATYAQVRGADEQRRLTAAHFMIQTALSQQQSPQAQHALGRVLLAEGDPQAALKLLNEALTAAPNDSSLRNDKAVALAEIKDFEGAMRELEAVLQTTPADPAALFNYAIINRQLGRKEVVEEYLRRLQSAEPSTQWAAELSNLDRSHK